LPLSQPDAGTAAVLVDEFDACGFQRHPNPSRSAFATAEFANRPFKPSIAIDSLDRCMAAF
jgi:hypothetical protein